MKRDMRRSILVLRRRYSFFTARTIRSSRKSRRRPSSRLLARAPRSIATNAAITCCCAISMPRSSGRTWSIGSQSATLGPRRWRLQQLDDVAVRILRQAYDIVAERWQRFRLARHFATFGADARCDRLRIADVEDELDRIVLVVALGTVGPMHQHDGVAAFMAENDLVHIVDLDRSHLLHAKRADIESGRAFQVADPDAGCADIVRRTCHLPILSVCRLDESRWTSGAQYEARRCYSCG